MFPHPHPHPPYPLHPPHFFFTTSFFALPEKSISPHPPHLPNLILFFLTIVMSVFPSHENL